MKDHNDANIRIDANDTIIQVSIIRIISMHLIYWYRIYAELSSFYN